MAKSNEKEQHNPITLNEPEHPSDDATIEERSIHPSVQPRSYLLMHRVTPVIAVAALLVAGYTYYVNTNFNTTLLNENKQLSSELHQLQQQQNATGQQVKSSTAQQQQAMQEIEQKITDASKHLQQLAKQKSNQTQDWLLLKARYYLELAQINAHWSTSSNDHSTIELLHQADIILSQINSADLFEIRQTIANEITQLKSESTVDMPGILSRLDAVQNNVALLDFQTATHPNNNSNTTSPQQTNTFSWQDQLHNSLNKLSDLVVIRRTNEEIKPLLSPIYESILKENVRLNIQQAQWAVININPHAYQLALNHVITTLKRGFNERLPNIISLINELTQLQKVDLQQKKPNVGQALTLLNRLIEQQQAVHVKERNQHQEQEL